MSATADDDSKGKLTTNNPHPSNSKQSSKKGKKRKRIKQSAEEQYQIERTDRYNKLHHACSKHFHREAKIVKSFECQKIVRAIKAAKESTTSGEETRTSKSQKRIETLQQKLERTKRMELDELVHVGLKRLGVLSLDPTVHKEDNREDDDVAADDDGSNNQSTSDAKTTLSQADDPFYQTLVESMFRHKRLSTALDELNEKVTEYRQWTVRKDAILQGRNNQDPIMSGDNKKKKKKKNQSKVDYGNDTMVVAGGFNSRKRGLDLGGHEGASGLFIGSLSGMVAEGYGDDEQYMDGNSDDYYEYQQEKKKNRPGQRARRAKAMAIEARNAGKTWDSSINWREKKKGDDGEGTDDRDRGRGGGKGNYNLREDKGSKRNEINVDTKPKEAQHIATMGKTWKEDGNAHPSWAAKAAAQKNQGIAKFAGKKITFD